MHSDLGAHATTGSTLDCLSSSLHWERPPETHDKTNTNIIVEVYLRYMVYSYLRSTKHDIPDYCCSPLRQLYQRSNYVITLGSMSTYVL